MVYGVLLLPTPARAWSMRVLRHVAGTVPVYLPSSPTHHQQSAAYWLGPNWMQQVLGSYAGKLTGKYRRHHHQQQSPQQQQQQLQGQLQPRQLKSYLVLQVHSLAWLEVLWVLLEL